MPTNKGESKPTRMGIWDEHDLGEMKMIALRGLDLQEAIMTLWSSDGENWRFLSRKELDAQLKKAETHDPK